MNKGTGCHCEPLAPWERELLNGGPIGMTLTIHTGPGVTDVLVFENVHVDSVKIKGDTLQWEEDGGRLRCYSIPLSRVLYWESE